MASAGAAPEGVDIERPSAARLYDWFLGGRHNYASDRELGRQVLDVAPNFKFVATQNRAFLGRAVRFLLASGIRQFLDLGSGIPTQDNVHEVVHRAYPSAHVVYVDNDPVAVAHSRYILQGNDNAAVVRADIREPDAVVGRREVLRLIDFSEPVAVLFVAILHFIPDSDEPHALVGKFRDHMAPGSYLVVSHGTQDVAATAVAGVEHLYQRSTVSAHARSRPQIEAFFDGFDLVEPGLVYPPLWRPEGPGVEHPELSWFYSGVGRRS
jgi:S-adenosyl methyltransferase